ncbi:class C sortase [Microbacterium sp. XT11]|uniref:class C sortase n=1 Tax=Microbacterium sp. XT11 TaxID=367477 RepID=UPI000AEF2769|nr:class C sortase [Microbacterium sp. XT11]
MTGMPTTAHDAGSDAPAVGSARTVRRWRPGGLTIAITLLALAGLVSGLYPMTAAWVTSYNQSRVIETYESAVRHAAPDASEQLRQAKEYNEALTAGVVLAENANVPVGDGTLSESLDYRSILSANADGLMARVKIPSIDVDLPVFHGTTDDVLNKGAGHLEGSHLPIGGESTRAVITAHRGLANATMFTDLDKVVVGDLITVETFGKVLTYRVRDIQVIEPDANGTIRPEVGEDLLTLITCTPLGINTHRIVVTGERVTPTPVREVEAAGAAPTIPGFPWWAVLGGGGLLLIAAYAGWQGVQDAGQRRPRTRTERVHTRDGKDTARAERDAARGEER